MKTEEKTSNNQIIRDNIVGSRRFSNYFWAVVVFFGGSGFLLAGLSSYWHMNLLPFTDTSQLQFIPQGITLCFYGVAALLLSTYLGLTILWNVGGGYNEFNKETGKLTIFRYGFPGKNRQVKLEILLKEIQSIRAEVKEGINPKRVLYIRAKQRRDIPLLGTGGELLSLSVLENKAAELAKFLQVPLEGL